MDSINESTRKQTMCYALREIIMMAKLMPQTDHQFNVPQIVGRGTEYEMMEVMSVRPPA